MIQTGDILLFKGTTPIISPIIRWFTDSEYTHAALAITENLIYEIDFNKRLAIRPIREETYDVFRYKYGLTWKQQNAIKTYAIERANTNKGYDWLRILSFGLQKIFQTKKAFDEANRVICSEIVDQIYAHIGIDLVPDRENGDVAPSHLALSPYLVKVFSHLA